VNQNGKLTLLVSEFSWKKNIKLRKRITILATCKMVVVYQNLYDAVQDAGFHLVFREHNSAMKGTKKGNVDSDIIFSIMKRLYLQEDFDKVVLVSGDGDYKQLVDFLIEQRKFEKVLFPKQIYASSLYKKMGEWYKADLSEPNTRKKIGK